MMGVRHDKPFQLVTKPSEYFLGLFINAFVENLSKITESIDTRNQSSQSLMMPDRIRDPFAAIGSKLLDPSNRQKLVSQLFLNRTTERCVRQNYIVSAQTLSCETARFVDLFGKVTWAQNRARFR